MFDTLRTSQTAFLVAVAGYALAVAGVQFIAGTNRWWPVTGVALLLSSTAPMAFVGQTIEGRDLRADMFNPDVGSWAFIFGDAICLPLAGVFFAVGLKKACAGGDGDLKGALGLPTKLWWWLPTMLAGLVFGIWFRAREAGTYDVLRDNSPGKLYHDFAAYPLLAGSLLYLGLPVILVALSNKRARKWAVLGVVAFAGWFALGTLHDGNLNPDLLHVPYVWES